MKTVAHVLVPKVPMYLLFFGLKGQRHRIERLFVCKFFLQKKYKNSSGDEIANMNFYAVRP